jgi:hypothetical protein
MSHIQTLLPLPSLSPTYHDDHQHAPMENTRTQSKASLNEEHVYFFPDQRRKPMNIFML